MLRKITLVLLMLTLACALPALAQEKADLWPPGSRIRPQWRQYTPHPLSNVASGHLKGLGGIRIRDKVWERSKGQLYVDFRPLAQLGGERDVIQKLKLGAVQGMLCSSVAAANVADKLGVVNLPYVVDTFDKLDKFRSTPALWDEFKNSARPQGLIVADITGYGTYGWATTTPVRSLEEAKKVNFRIAEAPVNTDIYKSWGLKFTVMPWPDVPQALQTGVINGLDHPHRRNIQRMFDGRRTLQSNTPRGCSFT
jgi:TRAP-type C4-dicarboxylate transport system substrate-binding protein